MKLSRDVISVEPLDGYRLRLEFEGGEWREIDISSLGPFEGVFAPLRDRAYFRQVRVEPDIGTIMWPSGADICPDVLYARSHPLHFAAAESNGPV